MNAQVTSREAILAQCRQLVMEGGMRAVNMRTVASSLNVALGSLYNYFPSKAELITATVESVWKDIFHASLQTLRFDSFLQAAQWMFDSLARGSKTYPGFFTLHAMSFANQDKADGRRLMQQYFDMIKQMLLDTLMHDPHIRPDAFHAELSPMGVVTLTFDAVIATTLQHGPDIGTLLSLLRRALYSDADA